MLPLLRHLDRPTAFIEPAAGDGALVRHLERLGHRCVAAFDIEPQPSGQVVIGQRDATGPWVTGCHGQADCFISNLPWSRPLLHELIRNLTATLPLWTLLDADWPHTRQAVPFLPLLRKIVAVGRVQWVEGSKFQAKDNCVWLRFDGTARPRGVEVEFYGRTEAANVAR